MRIFIYNMITIRMWSISFVIFEVCVLFAFEVPCMISKYVRYNYRVSILSVVLIHGFCNRHFGLRYSFWNFLIRICLSVGWLRSDSGVCNLVWVITTHRRTIMPRKLIWLIKLFYIPSMISIFVRNKIRMRIRLWICLTTWFRHNKSI